VALESTLLIREPEVTNVLILLTRKKFREVKARKGCLCPNHLLNCFYWDFVVSDHWNRWPSNTQSSTDYPTSFGA